MTRARHVVVLTALPLLLVTACAGPAQPAAPGELAAAAEPHGIAPDLVYVTEIDGFTLAAQSVGVYGSDGMSAAYTGSSGTVMLTTGREPSPSAPPCDQLPGTTAGGELSCSVVHGAAHVLLAGDGVDAEVLRAAGAAVRVPTTRELDGLFGGLSTPHPPVERGDLPEWDGAPDNEPGPGG